MKGYVQVYTGDGKGKTTAALGLVLRAVGAGLRVYLGQFIKGRESSEVQALRRHLPSVTVELYGLGHFIGAKPTPADIRAAGEGLARLKAALTGGAYDLVVGDEANVAAHLGLLTVDALLELVDAKPDPVELVLTGRQAAARLIERADLVTEMQCIKHYFEQGVPARRGIEE